jgi:alpha-ketoglutarate-dependent taurine dioxygenase
VKFLEVDLSTCELGSFISGELAATDWPRLERGSQEELLKRARAVIQDRVTAGKLRLAEIAPDLATLVGPRPPWGLAILKGLDDVGLPRAAIFLLGEILGYVMKYPGEGDYLIEVREDPTATAARPGFNNSREFFGHTDLSYTDCPPPFFFLHSLLNDESQGGLSEFADLTDILAELSDEQIAVLKEPLFLFPAPTHFAKGGGAIRQPVLRTAPPMTPEYSVRFRRDALRTTSRPAIDAVIALVQAVEKVQQEFFLEPHAVAIINNERVLHGRTAFLAGGSSGSIRHINRIYIDFEPPDGAYCD